MSRKRARRINETNQEFEEAVAVLANQQIVASKSDAELFVIDREGSKNIRKKVVNKIIALKNDSIISATEKKLIKKIQANPLPPKVSHKRKPDLHDLWNVNESQIEAKTTVRPKRINILPDPGQSYNPSFEDHQNLLEKALKLEIKRDEEKKYALEPFSKPIPLVIRDKFEESDNESELSDEDNDMDENDNNHDSNHIIKSKLKERMTRSQRNKQKLGRLKQTKVSKRIQEKNLSKSINNLHSIIKDINKNEKLNNIKKELQILQKNELEIKNNQTVFTYKESNQIPLTDELKGNLRLIKPKGLSSMIQQQNLLKNNLFIPKNRRKSRKYEHPHGAKRLVWIPKHKYTGSGV